MSGLTLHGFPNYFRTAKCTVTAKYAGVDVEVKVPKNFPQDVKTEAFLKLNPLGKVPTLETPEGGLFESNAIGRYLASMNPEAGLLGEGLYEQALVDEWATFALTELTPRMEVWLYPILGYIPYNRAATEKAKTDTQNLLKVLNNHLATRTYLVNERVTFADIIVSLTLQPAYTMVFDPEYRKPFPHVNRWFVTLMKQEEFASELPPLVLANEMKSAQPAKKEKKQKQPQAKKENTKADKPAAAAEPKKEKKGKNPLDVLPKSSFDLEEWKRQYSNNDTRPVALPWLWENFDAEGFSFYKCEYIDAEKYLGGDNTFMVANLVGGFFQRLDKLRKYGFGSMIIYGENKAHSLGGVWIFRGKDIPFEMKDCPDYEVYDFTPLDHTVPENKKYIEDVFAWDGDFDGRKFCSGKVFK